MWNRAELKYRAKIAFKANYWRCVLAALILSLLVGGAAGSVSGSVNGLSASFSTGAEQTQSFFESFSPDQQAFLVGVILAILGMLVGVAIVSTLLSIFVFNVLEIGGCKFFTDNAQEPAEVGNILHGFKCGHYGKIVLTLFLRGLFISLWSLLFVIPGIVKAYSYRMVPYIMADDPQVSRQDAFDISREMMRGNKWRTFVLDLSFIGWEILSCLTFGILEIFYVAPYRNATYAELYLALRDANAEE